METLLFFEDLLKDKKDVEKYRQLREAVSELNTELLKFANETFGWCIEHARKSGKVFHNTLLGLARHNLVYMDCVSTLLKNGNVEGCQPLLRSMLEAMLGIMHIVEKKSEQRALAYRFVRVKQVIQKFQMGDKNHEEGKRVEAELANDMYTPKALDLLAPGNYAVKADKLERWLSSQAEFAPIIAEWDRLKNPPGKKPNKRNPEWYTLFGEATSIRQLANKLKCSGMYLFLYKDMSNVTHAGCALDTLTVGDELRPLRYPQQYHGAVRLNFLMFIGSFEKLASFYDNGVLGEPFRKHVIKTLESKCKSLADEIEKVLTFHK